jgi:hypothetical protein
LAVGYKHQRSYVIRGDRIGVFKHDHDALEYSTTIDSIATPSGKRFAPSKVMLHDQDSSMVLMDPNKPNALFKMDLEYGKVVEEWVRFNAGYVSRRQEVDENRELVDFTHDAKYAQMTPAKTFVGISHNALFRIDPRQSGSKLVTTQLNQYQSKNSYSCTLLFRSRWY